MKLIDVLQGLDPEQPIKIGAKDGSSFFYVGTPADMLATFDTSSVRYGEYDMTIYRSYEKAIKRLELEVSIAYDNAMEDAQKRGAELTAKGFKKALKTIFRSEMAQKILKAEGKLADVITHQRQTKAMQDREVMDSFQADKVVDDSLNIIVEGFEYGRYWTYEESDKPSIKLNNSEVEMK